MRRLIDTILCLCAVATLCSGCGSGAVERAPVEPPIVENEALEYLLEAGCESAGENSVKCSDVQMEILNKCSQIDNAPDEVAAGMEDDAHIAICAIRCDDDYDRCREIQDNQEYVYAHVGFNSIYYQYIVIHDGEFQIISNRSDFREYFGEIESDDEALALAVGLHLYGRPLYNFDTYINYGWTQVSMAVEVTHVEISDDAYIVNLFYDTDVCLTGEMGALHESIVSVGADGETSIVSDEVVYDSLKENKCIVD